MAEWPTKQCGPPSTRSLNLTDFLHAPTTPMTTTTTLNDGHRIPDLASGTGSAVRDWVATAQVASNPNKIANKRFLTCPKHELASELTPRPSSQRASDEDQDAEMQLSSEQAIANALAACRCRVTTSSRDFLVKKHDAMRAKVDVATSDYGIVQVFPLDWQSSIWDFISRYRNSVDLLTAATSALGHLNKHKSNKSFPTALNAIRLPTIEFNKAFVDTPLSQGHRHNFNCAGLGSGSLETVNELRITNLKEQILDDWITEKKCEITFLELKASPVNGLIQLEQVIKTCAEELKYQHDYLSSYSRHRELIQDVDFQTVVGLSLALSIIRRVNKLIQAEEDKKLCASLKKMAIDTPVVEAALQAPPNDYSKLMKSLVQLGKEIHLRFNKVGNSLYVPVLASVGIVMLTSDPFQCPLVNCI